MSVSIGSGPGPAVAPAMPSDARQQAKVSHGAEDEGSYFGPQMLVVGAAFFAYLLTRRQR